MHSLSTFTREKNTNKAFIKAQDIVASRNIDGEIKLHDFEKKTL